MSELEITNAEAYAQLESPDDEIEIVPMPSGARFKMRRADIQGMALIGLLPQSLVNQGLAAWKKQGKLKGEVSTKEIEASLLEQSPEETIELFIFYRQIVVENVLQPRIGFNDSGVVSLLNEEGKAIARLQQRDFHAAFRWITRQEGKEATGLSTFRKGREGGTATVSSDSEGRRDESVTTVERTQ